MKKKNNWKGMLLAAGMVLSLSACQKDPVEVPQRCDVSGSLEVIVSDALVYPPMLHYILRDGNGNEYVVTHDQTGKLQQFKESTQVTFSFTPDPANEIPRCGNGPVGIYLTCIEPLVMEPICGTPKMNHYKL